MFARSAYDGVCYEESNSMIGLMSLMKSLLGFRYFLPMVMDPLSEAGVKVKLWITEGTARHEGQINLLQNILERWPSC